MNLSPTAKYLVIVVIALVLIFIAFNFLSSKATSVEIRDQAPWFSPALLEIDPGTTVTWHLKSPAVHPIMAIEGPEEIHSGHFTNTWSYTFNKPGVYVYICPIHPYMKGVIAVGTKIPKEKIPAWINWPPSLDESKEKQKPKEAGIGKIWLDAQFHMKEGKEKPGTIIIINAKDWEIETIIDDARLNNPHNLWEFDGKMLQTNWFDKYLSVIDTKTKEIEKHIWLGESPAHVMSVEGTKRIYVTLQGDDAIAILDENFELLEKIRAPKGPHGHWMSADGTIMALASTEKGKISVWNLTNNEIIFEAFLDGENKKDQMRHDEKNEEHSHSLPLMAAVTQDGKFAFTATSNTGKFFVFDVSEKKLLKSFAIGSVPIQVVPSPDDAYVLVPLTGSGEIAVVETQNWTLLKKVPGAGFGAHAVAYGRKNRGGYYAYISSKFVNWITVIDMDTLAVAGYITLPKEALGGQGIFVTET